LSKQGTVGGNAIEKRFDATTKRSYVPKDGKKEKYSPKKGIMKRPPPLKGGKKKKKREEEKIEIHMQKENVFVLRYEGGGSKAWGEGILAFF